MLGVIFNCLADRYLSNHVVEDTHHPINTEANPMEEIIKYHTLYKVINNIEKDTSAYCIGKLAEEPWPE